MSEKELNNLSLIIIAIVLFCSFLFFDYVLNEKEKPKEKSIKINVLYNGTERQLK